VIGRKNGPDEGLIRAGPSYRTSCDGSKVYGAQIGVASVKMRQSPEKWRLRLDGTEVNEC